MVPRRVELSTMGTLLKGKPNQKTAISRAGLQSRLSPAEAAAEAAALLPRPKDRRLARLPIRRLARLPIRPAGLPCNGGRAAQRSSPALQHG